MACLRNDRKLTVWHTVPQEFMILDWGEFVLVSANSKTWDLNAGHPAHEVKAIVADPILVGDTRITLSRDDLNRINDRLGRALGIPHPWINRQRLAAFGRPAGVFQDSRIDT